MSETNPPEGIPPRRSAAPVFGPPGQLPPFPVPDHTLIRCIGRGAYGEVWLARNALGTWRAVKFVLRDSFDDERPLERELAGIERFEPISRGHESQLNILQVGRAEPGFYYVMELADDMGRGQEIDEASYTPRNLRSELHLRGRLPAAECLRIGLALTTGLDYLHRQGLVHRDIKPSNIVFVNGIPKLADIGLVARAEATMSFVGTEGFLPPEGPGTRQADIYSLGKVLYEISTGHDRHQFPELPTNIVEMPDRETLSELNEVLLKACHRDPKERYETAAEMHAELALVESGRSVARFRGIERRLRLVQRAGTMVAIVAVLASALYLWQARQTRIVRELANQNRVIAEEKTRLAAEKSALAEENRERIVRLDIANGVRLLDEGDPSAALLWFAEALPLVAQRPSEDPVHRIRIQQVLESMPPLHRVFAFGENVRSGGFSPDGSRVVLGTRRGTIETRDVRTGKMIWQQRRAAGGECGQLRYTKSGKRILLSSSFLQANALMPAVTNEFVAVLDAETGARIYDLTGNPGFVYSAFSPDDHWIACADAAHVITIINAEDGKTARELKGHTDSIKMLAFSPDSQVLASGSYDQTVRLWRVSSGEPMGTPIPHEGAVRRVVFSPSGRRLATATDSRAVSERNSSDTDAFVQTWDVDSGRATGPRIRLERYAFMLSFGGHAGEYLLTRDSEKGVAVWDAETHQKKPYTFVTESRSWSLNPDGLSVAIGNDGGRVHFWDLATGAQLAGPFQHAGFLESVQFSPDGSHLLTTSDDGTARVWNLSSPTNSMAMRFDADIESSGFSSGSWKMPGLLAVPLKDGTIRLMDPGSLREVHRLTLAGHTTRSRSLESGPRGHAWAVFRQDYPEHHERELLEVWRERDGVVGHFAIPYTNMNCIPRFSPDEEHLFTCLEGPNVQVWRASDGVLEQVIPLPEHSTWVYDFLPDVNRAIVMYDNSGPGVWEIASRRALYTIPGLPFRVQSTACDPPGQRLAVLGGQYATVLDLASGKTTSDPVKARGGIVCSCFSPDGSRLLTSCLGRNLQTWDSSNGELLLQSQKMDGAATLVQWTEDGGLVFASSEPRKDYRVWDATTLEPVTPKSIQRVPVLMGAMGRDGRMVTAIGPNGLEARNLLPSRMPTDVLLDWAKLLSCRRLNPAGVLLPLRAEEVKKLFVSLRSRAPDLFE